MVGAQPVPQVLSRPREPRAEAAQGRTASRELRNRAGPEPLLPAPGGTGPRSRAPPPRSRAPAIAARRCRPPAPLGRSRSPGCPLAAPPARPPRVGAPGPYLCQPGSNRRRDEPGPPACEGRAGREGLRGQAARTGGQAQGSSLGREADPAAAAAPTPAPAALTFAVVAGSDVRGAGRAGRGSARPVRRRQIRSAPAASGNGRGARRCAGERRCSRHTARERCSRCAGERQQRSRGGGLS